jgi:pimeloyl-ACP methyl ester carboxylesterase
MSVVSLTVTTGDGLVLPLWRYPVETPERSVLLLHGGSASAETFVVPASRSLVSHLNGKGFDVWALDWRGSNLVAGKPAPSGATFSLDAAARNDLPAAFMRVRQAMTDEGRGEQRLSLMGHCLGGGLVAAGIATRTIDLSQVGSVVLSALGLFYAAPWDGMVKVQDYVIEQVLEHNQVGGTVDVGPGTRFPSPMDASYVVWPATLRVPCDCQACYQLSFMYGHPFLERNLCDGIHNDATLAHLFNHMPLRLFQHCGQNLRRGVYAPLNASEDLLELTEQEKPSADAFTMRVTLVTGEQNMLWHRESIDRMYEWLRSHAKRDCVKHVLPGYAHQDLLWGKRSQQDVFPLIEAGLR